MGKLLRILAILLLLAGGGIVALGAAFLQDQPAVATMRPPEPEDVQAARIFYREAQAATSGAPGAPRTVTLTVDTLQSVLRLGSRLVPGYRAETGIEDDAVWLRAAVPVPWIGGSRWLNLRAVVAPFEDRFTPSQVQIGGRDVPPGLALRLARLGGNLIAGSGVGDRLFDAPSAMEIDGERMIFALRLDREGRSEVMQGVFGALRGGDMPPPGRVDHYYVQLRDAIDRLDAPAEGSFAPLLRLAIEKAYAQSDAVTAPDEFTAAILALAKACGAVDFWMVFGPTAGKQSEDLGTWRNSCRDFTLEDRIDLRRHFVTAAALKAASNRGFAVSLGEFKELHDTLHAGGFDFTDIVANNSGIRLAELFLSRPRADWPPLFDRIRTDRDVIPALDGIPGVMPRDRFTAEFGDIDGPVYREMIDRIEARISATSLHAGASAGGG